MTKRIISREHFVKRMGRLPEMDDMARCNCGQQGEFGHFQCGWCDKCDLPRFQCGHLFNRRAAEFVRKAEGE